MSKQDALWIIPFTLLIVGTILVAGCLLGWWTMLLLYLWVGFLIWAVTDFEQGLWVILWLPALYSERLRNKL